MTKSAAADHDPSTDLYQAEASDRLDQMAADLLADVPKPHASAAVALARQVARSTIRLEHLNEVMDAAVEECPRTLFKQLERLTRLRELEARVLQRCAVSLEVMKAGLAGPRTVTVLKGNGGQRTRRGAR